MQYKEDKMKELTKKEWEIIYKMLGTVNVKAEAAHMLSQIFKKIEAKLEEPLVEKGEIKDGS